MELGRHLALQLAEVRQDEKRTSSWCGKWTQSGASLGRGCQHHGQLRGYFSPVVQTLLQFETLNHLLYLPNSPHPLGLVKSLCTALPSWVFTSPSKPSSSISRRMPMTLTSLRFQLVHWEPCLTVSRPPKFGLDLREGFVASS